MTTSGESSPAILAQSIGGGGGAAGGSWDFAAFASISIGGSGGSGGNGGDVTVNSLNFFVTGNKITTSGPGSQGISAQSIGGGGGGSAGVALGFPTEFTAGAAYSFAFTLGGSGGSGGNGGDVTVNNISSIVTQDADFNRHLCLLRRGWRRQRRLRHVGRGKLHRPCRDAVGRCCPCRGRHRRRRRQRGSGHC